MKVTVQVVVGLLLLAASAVCWRAVGIEERLAEAYERVATLRPVPAADTGVERTLGYVAGISGAADRRLRDLHRLDASAEYWQHDYGPLTPRRDSAGELVEHDPRLLLLGANADFRRLLGGDRNDTEAMLRSLDAVVATYLAALKEGGADEDTAYNYEYAIRLRTITKNRKPRAPGSGAAVAAATPAPRAVPTDLPDGPTIHGAPGAPPEGTGTGMGQFKTVIPKEEQERQDDATNPGRGGEIKRKG